MENCLCATIDMPISYSLMDTEEMTYVEGGGTVNVTIKASTIRNTVGVLGGAVSGIAIQAALDGLAAALVTPIEIGSGGLATVAVATFLVMWNGVAAQIATGIMSGIVGVGASAVYKGGDIKKSFTHDNLPNLNLSV